MNRSLTVSRINFFTDQAPKVFGVSTTTAGMFVLTALIAVKAATLDFMQISVRAAQNAPVTASPRNQVVAAPVVKHEFSVIEKIWQRQTEIKGVTLERETGDQGLRVILNSDAFFQSGTASVIENSRPILSEITTLLESAKSQAQIEIEAYTDASPVVKQKKLYPSNWELSLARAASMVHVFEKAGFPKSSLKVVGFGDSRPLAEGASASDNRRIVFLIKAREEDSKPL